VELPNIEIYSLDLHSLFYSEILHLQTTASCPFICSIHDGLCPLIIKHELLVSFSPEFLDFI
jgi:hypothetical protein